MLNEEKAGRPYVKARHRGAVSHLIGRSDGSVERKYMNVSAVLTKPGLPRIRGYAPNEHAQFNGLVADDATNSYKHLYFAALLDALRDSGFKARAFPISSLLVGMLAAAWYPVRFYRLSLGSHDQVDTISRKVKLSDDGPIPARRLRAALAASDPDTGDLKKYVPYRLVAPFFADRLRGIPDHQRNGWMRLLSIGSLPRALCTVSMATRRSNSIRRGRSP